MELRSPRLICSNVNATLLGIIFNPKPGSQEAPKAPQEHFKNRGTDKIVKSQPELNHDQCGGQRDTEGVGTGQRGSQVPSICKDVYIYICIFKYID